MTAGEFIVEPATLINLGFEWFIEGDANRTASVEVSFRKTGTSACRTTLPLLRLNGERVRQGTQLDVTVPNMFAGSILDLEPDTSYEAQFILKDAGGAPTTVTTARGRPGACRVPPRRNFSHSFTGIWSSATSARLHSPPDATLERQGRALAPR